LRALPAIIWYGIGTWIAALAMDGILKTLVGFTAAAAPYVYFVVLQVLQTALAYRGIRTMKWFNVIGSVVITAVMIYMMAHILNKYGFQMQAQWNTAPNWGARFGLADPAIGILATVHAQHQRHDAGTSSAASVRIGSDICLVLCLRGSSCCCSAWRRAPHSAYGIRFRRLCS